MENMASPFTTRGRLEPLNYVYCDPRPPVCTWESTIPSATPPSHFKSHVRLALCNFSMRTVICESYLSVSA